MVTMTGQKKHSVQASILLVLVVGLVAPAYAGTLRYDFDDIRPHKMPGINQRLQIDGWKLNRQVGGIGVGAWFISVEDGFVKIMDGGAGIYSSTGIYRFESWTDYEVKTRIQVMSLGATGVVLLVRAQLCMPQGNHQCWGGPGVWKDGGPGFQGSAYRIWSGDPVDVGRWYDVRIVAEGDRVTCFLDGQEVSEETTDIMHGGVAFLTEQSQVWLDYIEITGDDILPVQPRGRLATCWAKLKRS